MKRLVPLILGWAFACLVVAPGRAAEIQVAVASNFGGAMREVAARFEATTGHTVNLSPGSTGKHYAQIRNGAPFHVFLAADTNRPARLEAEGLVVAGTRFTYALGKLVLWSPREGYVDGRGHVLSEGNFRHLAMAHPRLAPYGTAALEVMKARGVWEELRGRVVRGENIGQAFQFVASGNAELGFVAYSQVSGPGEIRPGSLWEVPQDLYTPIRQQAVLVKEHEAARQLLRFLRSEEALKVIKEYGYDAP